VQEPFFSIEEKQKDKNYGVFVISPLEQGYGYTLGNSLRRVLLTSLPGAAIVSVSISQVKHQFSTLKGMREDVVEFLLNLKKVRLSYDGDQPIKGELSIVGPGEVRASDIKFPPQVRIANPDHFLAFLNEGGKIEAKLEVQKGFGYSPAEERATGEIGLIPLDASFSPILRVNYKVEETRVGRLTNFDKLILEILTDGTITPREALISASKILISYFEQIVSPKKVKFQEEEDKKKIGDDQLSQLSVEELGLPTRVVNALIKAGFETVKDLISAKREDIVGIRNLGEKSLKVIEATLKERGFSGLKI